MIGLLAWQPGLAQQAQPKDAPAGASGGQENVTVNAPRGLKPFDMKQCYEDDRGCQLATCVSVLTRDGTITICQSHGNFFP